MAEYEYGDTIYKEGAALHRGSLVRRSFADIVTIESVKSNLTTDAFTMANGPALRDALLEAFPLEDGAEIAGSHKPDVVPGMVFGKGKGFVILPGERYYNLILEDVFSHEGLTWVDHPVTFDPRDAKALPSPLGIRVGDTVRRVREVDGEKHAVEFEVHYISTSGYLSSKYGSEYAPQDFTVTSREVPDRLPAGTITRSKRHGGLRLVTAEGHINLDNGYVVPRDNGPTADVRSGRFEVIYLP